MKKLNKKNILIVILILIILILISYIIFGKNRKNEGLIEDDDTIATEEMVGNSDEYDYEIRSTKENPLEKNGMEAKSIKLHAVGDQIEVTTILKNNTSELIKGYNITIDLINSRGNTVTTIAENSETEIGDGQSIELKNYVMGITNPKSITDAKIVELEKGSIATNIENSLEETTPDIEE